MSNYDYTMRANQQSGAATAEQLRKQQAEAFARLKAMAMARIISRREPAIETYYDMYA